MLIPNVQLVEITPEMAAEFLKTMRKNRPVRARLVNRLTSDITQGNWRVNGEPIIFDNEGHLIDGQHRLLACIAADKTITCYVVRGGIDDNAVTSIDTGMARQPGDALAMNGIPQGNKVAAVLRWVYRYNNDDMMLGIKSFSREDLLGMVDDYPEIYNSIVHGNKISKFLTPSLAAALHLLMRRKDPLLADQFFDDVATGLIADQTDPVYLLREALIRNRLRQSRFSTPHMGALCIKAWNACRQGRRTLKRLAWYPTEFKNNRSEKYPTIL